MGECCVSRATKLVVVVTSRCFAFFVGEKKVVQKSGRENCLRLLNRCWIVAEIEELKVISHSVGALAECERQLMDSIYIDYNDHTIIASSCRSGPLVLAWGRPTRTIAHPREVRGGWKKCVCVRAIVEVGILIFQVRVRIVDNERHLLVVGRVVVHAGVIGGNGDWQRWRKGRIKCRQLL